MAAKPKQKVRAKTSTAKAAKPGRGAAKSKAVEKLRANKLANTKPTPKPAAKPTPVAKPKKRRPITVASVLGKVLEIKDPIERTAAIEAKLDRVPDPSGLMKAWFEASLGLAGCRELTAETALVMSHARTSDAKFLDVVGRELARRNFKNEAIEVFRLAMAAGSTNDSTASGDLAGARDCLAKSLEIRAGEPGDDVTLLGAALGGDPEKLEAELAFKYRHLPAPPFVDYVACLRRIAASG